MNSENDTQSGRLNLKNPEMKTSYANFSHVHINATDVYLYFGVQDGDGSVEDVSVNNRIVITHDAFMRMMEFWSTRYSVLEAIYEDTPRNLRDFSKDKVDRAFAKFLGPLASVDEQEEDKQER